MTHAWPIRDRVEMNELAAVLISDLPKLLTEVADLLRPRWPDYAAFLDENSGSVAEAAMPFVRRLLSAAQRELVSLKPRPLEAEPAVQMTFEQIGRMHFKQGNDLAELLPAYRLGARAAWRHVSAAALRLELPAHVLASLGEAVFEFIDQLASASTRGYVHEQSESSAERERLRQELCELLLSDRSDSAAVRSACERACWPAPADAALVLVDPADRNARAVVDRLDRRCLMVRRPNMYGAVVPGTLLSAGRRDMERMLHGAPAIVGRVVPLEEFPASVDLPQIGLALQRRSLLRGGPIFVDDHLDTIIVHRDAELVAALRKEVLRPLDDLPAGTRARLTETLSAWLRNMGDRTAMADELFIHPQTVRYRMTQLRDYFGAELDSPRGRARMFLALGWDPST
jgi:hypothetical protein